MNPLNDLGNLEPQPHPPVSAGEMSGYYSYRQQTNKNKEVSFLEFVEVSTTDSSISPDLTTSTSSGNLTTGTTITLHCSPSRPPLPPHHHFHYEPLRPPAAIHPAIITHQSSSSTNSNSSNSPSPLVSIDPPLLSGPPTGVPPYPDGYQLLLSPRTSLTNQVQPQVSSPYSIFQTDNSHLFTNTSISPQLLQFASPPLNSLPNQYYNPSYQTTTNSGYETLQPPGLGPLLPENHPNLLNETVISKSSSSDSDTNDSGTRLISDSLADIAGAASTHIYLMQSTGSMMQTDQFAGPSSGGQLPLSVSPVMDPSMFPPDQSSILNPDTATLKQQSDALWIQMQSELSKEMREKYLSVNGNSGNSGSCSSVSGNLNNKSNSNSNLKKNNKKKSFTFRRIGSGKYGFVCPLRQSTARFLTLALTIFLLLSAGLFLLFCYMRGWWIFEKSNTRNFGPDPDQYWWQGTTFYEIFPASFKDTDGDGYGDLEGIIQQVGYLRSLGVSAVRLSSIFAALDYPQRFDNVLNFFSIDPHLGRFQDFLKMIDVLHSNQIRVILELNPTLTSDQHPWAAHWNLNRTGEYVHFYENQTRPGSTNRNITDSAKYEESKETSIDAQDIASSTSTTHHRMHLEDTQFYFGTGLRLNWSHEAVRAELLKVATFWLHHVDGLYITNLHQIYLEPNLSGAHSRGAILHDFLRKLRAAAHEMNQKSARLSNKSHRSRKILICSSTFVEPFLNGIIKRRRSQDHRSPSHQFKPEFDDLDLDQTQLDQWDPTILANLHVMPYNQNSGTTLSSSLSSTSSTPTSRVKMKGQNGKAKIRKLYSYFDLVHFELNLTPTETDTIRDQVNYVFLNRPTDFPTILWSIGSVHRSRIANRLGDHRVMAGHFLLTMMPGTVSILYGDEIALSDVYDQHTHNKYRGGQLCPMAWSSVSPNGNFSLINVSHAQLWLPVHPEYGRLNVEKRADWVKAASDLNHFRLDHLYNDVQSGGRPLNSEINYLFHYIDDSVVVLEQHFDRRNANPSAQSGPSTSIVTSLDDDGDGLSISPLQSPMPSSVTRYRYVLFANLGNETVVKDFSDKFHFSMTQLATNVNRTSEFLIMRTLKLDPGEAMIATVE